MQSLAHAHRFVRPATLLSCSFPPKNTTKTPPATQLAELERADQLMSRLSRVAAAINLRTSDPLTESGHDPVVELRHYYGTVANNITMDWKVRG